MGKSKSTLKISIKVHIGTKKYQDLYGRLYVNNIDRYSQFSNDSWKNITSYRHHRKIVNLYVYMLKVVRIILKILFQEGSMENLHHLILVTCAYNSNGNGSAMQHCWENNIKLHSDNGAHYFFFIIKCRHLYGCSYK